MRALRLGLALTVVLGVSLPTRAAPQTRVSLVLAADVARPGDTILAAMKLQMAPGWHTYWVNPGDSGAATTISWELPAGVGAGDIQWPVPEKYTESDLTTYVYYDEVWLLIPLRLAADLKPGRLELKAKVSWLECARVCVQGSTRVAATFEVGESPKASAEIARFDAWQRRLPRTEPPARLRATWGSPPGGESRDLLVEWAGAGSDQSADFLPLVGKGYEVQAATARLAADAGLRRIRKPVTKTEGGWPIEVAGILVDARKPELLAYAVKLKPEGDQPTTSPAPRPSVAGSGARPVASLAVMLGFAFLGGLILNVMPCVLPVIALKVLSLVKQARQEPAVVRRHVLLYGLGVLVSFLVLAGIVIGIQRGGHLASWGMQFQSPEFLVVMAAVVTLVALNLFGVFEVTLGGRTIGAMAGLASREGAAGAFFNGFLATALATPCTAPFLSSAVGFAITQPSSGIVVLMFSVIGLGLAAPYVVLSFVPGLARFLPRPGAWMEKFKVAMGFPMLAASVWLLSLLARHYGTSGVLWVGVFLLLTSLAAWVWGEFVQRGRLRRPVGALVSLLFLLAGYGGALESQLHWRSPAALKRDARLPSKPGGIAWQTWSAAAVDQARSAGRPVLVDFTADWCVTCQANKRTSLEIPSVEKRVREINAVALLGDYTLQDDAITKELQRWDRAGVPLVLVYPKDSTRPPLVLPELLTPSIVLDALQKAVE